MCGFPDSSDAALNEASVDLSGGDTSVTVTVSIDSIALELEDTFLIILVPQRSLAPNEFLLDTLEVEIIDANGMLWFIEPHVIIIPTHK